MMDLFTRRNNNKNKCNKNKQCSGRVFIIENKTFVQFTVHV